MKPVKGKDKSANQHPVQEKTESHFSNKSQFEQI